MSGQFSSSESDDKSYIQNEQQRILKKSNIYKQKEQCNNSCVQHPNKKAKYYLQQDNSNLFCSKCALALALRGLKIEETQEKQPEIYRQQRIYGFQEQLSEVITQCSNKFSQLSNLMMNASKQLMEQKENCILFFETIINTSNQLKLTYLSKLETDHIDQLKQLTDKISLIQQINAQLTQFEIDIANNHENIVKNMEMKPFEDIMCRYEKKVSLIKVQIQEFNQEYLQKSFKFEHNQILDAMNKMCYTLLLKTEDSSEQVSQQPKLEATPKIIHKHTNSPANMKVMISTRVLLAQLQFQNLKNNLQTLYTCSNPVKDHIQSPGKSTTQILQQQLNTKVDPFSNPLSTLQNSKRESSTYTKTPQSWQFKGCLDRKNLQITPNERVSVKHNINIQCSDNQFELNDKSYEKQKITIEVGQEDLPNQQLISNINQLYCWNNLQIVLFIPKHYYHLLFNILEELQGITKQSDRDSFEDRQLTPKHQKNLTNATPQTFKLLGNHVNQKSQYQYPLVNNNVLEQKNQTELSKKNYDSQPQQKTLTPLHQNAQPRINNQLNHKQNSNLNRRANSKQPSIDQIEGKRQFILANMNIQSYTSQPNQDTAGEDTLKERILKELCSHPPESIYNQVLKQNCQSKQKNQKQPPKENVEQSTTGRMKNLNGYQCSKKQSYQL